MPDQTAAEGVVSRAAIAELATLFDQFEYAFDPLSLSAKEAEAQFEAHVLKLFRELVESKFPGVGFPTFRAKVRSHCRVYLQKNPA